MARRKQDSPPDELSGVAPPESAAAAHIARDTLFATASPEGGDTLAPFSFNADVARVFPDMLDRSIPGYASIVAQTGLLATRFAQPGTCLYDLGCSLGASSLAMRSALARPIDQVPGKPSDTIGANEEEAPTAESHLKPTDTDPSPERVDTSDKGRGTRGRDAFAGCRIVGVDNSSAMIDRARERVKSAESATSTNVAAPQIELMEADLTEHRLETCSFAAMNFTLQFIAPDARSDLLTRLAEAMVPGGALILSEKLRFEDAQVDALHVEMYHAFKRANGYSRSEIARKRAALENVLVPDTLAEHRERLSAAGFARSTVWFQCYNFFSLVALR